MLQDTAFVNYATTPFHEQNLPHRREQRAFVSAAGDATTEASESATVLHKVSPQSASDHNRVRLSLASRRLARAPSHRLGDGSGAG
jgi:hypothetical protein